MSTNAPARASRRGRPDGASTIAAPNSVTASAATGRDGKAVAALFDRTVTPSGAGRWTARIVSRKSTTTYSARSVNRWRHRA